MLKTTFVATLMLLVLGGIAVLLSGDTPVARQGAAEMAHSPVAQRAPSRPSRYVFWELSARDQHFVVKRGECIALHIRLKLARDHYTFTTKRYPKFGPSSTVITLTPSAIAQLGPDVTIKPPPKHEETLSELYKYDVEIIDRESLLTVPVRIADDAPLGETAFDLGIQSRAPTNWG